MITVDPFKQDIICASRDGAVALQAYARALPKGPRHGVRAGLYPDRHKAGCYRVALAVTRTGLLDGADAIKALRDYVKANRTGTVYRGERELALIP
jgi:hypothetical protein